MKIPLTINNESIVLECNPDESLMTVLHRSGLTSVKRGCGKGFCGACTVLLNDKPVASCKIPVGIVRDQKIITLEYFSQSEEYEDITKGFQNAGITLCGYCNSGKIFSTYILMKSSKIPSKNDITEYIRHLSPCCTDQDTLVNGITNAISIHRKRSIRKIK